MKPIVSVQQISCVPSLESRQAHVALMEHLAKRLWIAFTPKSAKAIWLPSSFFVLNTIHHIVREGKPYKATCGPGLSQPSKVFRDARLSCGHGPA